MGGIGSAGVPGYAQGGRRTQVVEAVTRAAPAVVSVLTEERPRMNPFGFSGLEAEEDGSGRISLGSGVIYDERGYVVTNEHVVAGAARIKVQLSDGRELPASLIGAERAFDVAVLQVETRGRKLPAVKVGTSRDLLIGETVIAIGNPFGLSHTVTTGVVSATHRTVKTRSRVYEDFIQTDAPINPGNSGGPLLNIHGELVGINTAVHSGGPGIGFAIPVDRARVVIEDLMSFGQVRQGWVGIHPVAAPGRSRQVGGVLVGEVDAGSPAERAGIRPGDLVLALGGEATPTVAAYRGRARRVLIGEEVTVRLARGEVRLRAVTPAPQESAAQIRQRLGLEVSMAGGRAVVVSSVARDGIAQRGGVQAGDIVLQVGPHTIRGLQEFNSALSEVLLGNDVVMLLVRGGSSYYVTLPM